MQKLIREIKNFLFHHKEPVMDVYATHRVMDVMTNKVYVFEQYFGLCSAYSDGFDFRFCRSGLEEDAKAYVKYQMEKMKLDFNVYHIFSNYHYINEGFLGD